jgi:dienelactone hydrolase
MLRGIGGVVAVVAVVIGAAAGGYVEAPSAGDPRFVVDAPVASAADPVHVRLVGVEPGDRVTITSSAHDAGGRLWQAYGVFTTDGSGSVDLADRAPSGGTYSGADAMGLFWSMNLVSGNQEPYFTVNWESGYRITLSAADGSGRLATTVITRRWTVPGETHRALSLSTDGVIGDIFLPPAGRAPHPAILLFGGSEGGNSGRSEAAVLASKGYPTLSLAYFDEPGLPSALENIPLEYFVTAGRILAAQPGVDPAHLMVWGNSRGSEAALLLADHFPTLFHGAIVSVPSAVVNTGLPDPDTAAWTLAGVPLPPDQTIPLTDVSGPVLAYTGSADALWPSPHWTAQIETELQDNQDPYQYRTLIYPGAGHGISGSIYLPAYTTSVDATGTVLQLGGTREADAHGREVAWAKILALLASLSPGQSP